MTDNLQTSTLLHIVPNLSLLVVLFVINALTLRLSHLNPASFFSHSALRVRTVQTIRLSTDADAG